MGIFNKEKTSNNLTFKTLLLLFVSYSCAKAAAQPSNNELQQPSVPPAMAIIIVILVAALFIVAFFSIYIRSRSPDSSIRQTLSMRRRGTVAAASRGLDASVIETSFPTFTYAQVKDHHIGKGALECAVCLNEFEDSDMLRLIPKCDHVFHPECIDVWLKSHVTCPVCRADLSSTIPQPDEAPEAHDQEQQPGDTQQNNDDVLVHIESDEVTLTQQEESRQEVKRNLSVKMPISNRPPRSFSIKRFTKFRSHSTGHSLVVPGQNLDRYTLRLPDNFRKELIRTSSKSCAVSLPRYGSYRRGYRIGNGEGSSSSRSFWRIGQYDKEAMSDRWVFSGSTSRSVKTAVKMPSFKCLEPKSDEPGFLTAHSARSTV